MIAWTNTCRSNRVKEARAGRLTPDGAFDTAALLNKTGRAFALGWLVSPDLVLSAHNEVVEAGAR